MEHIYHYTTLQGLYGMLNSPCNIIDNNLSNHQERNAFKMWATSIFNLNDPMEFMNGYIYIQKKIREIECELDINKSYRISNLFSFSSKTNKKIRDMLFEKVYSSELCPFVISFSHNQSSLPMWRMYGGDACGVCMQFDNIGYKIYGTDITNFDVKIIHKLNATNITYGKLDSAHFITSYLRKTYSEYNKDLEKKSPDSIIDYMLETYMIMFVFTAPFIKVQDYEYENEVRLVKYVEKTDEVKMRINNRGNIINYIEVPIPIEYLKIIEIGPCANFNLVKLNIMQMLKKYEVDIPIVKSNISYRQY